MCWKTTDNKFYKNYVRVFLWIKAICRIILIERKTSKYLRKRFTFKDKNICWWWWIIWSFSWLLAILILFKMENFKFVLSTSILHRHKMMLFKTRKKLHINFISNVPLFYGIFSFSFIFGLNGSLSLAFIGSFLYLFVISVLDFLVFFIMLILWHWLDNKDIIYDSIGWS